MLTRRRYLQLTLAAGAAALLPSGVLRAGQNRPRAAARDLITRPIPASGEHLPVVGLGSSATFAQVARGEDAAALAEVLQALVRHGGTVFDTAPGYGASEAVAGTMAKELGLTDKIFWATKFNVAPRGGGRADARAARAQLEESFARLHTPVIDLIQVHNVGDLATQLPLLKELKAEGRVRYIGVTTTFEHQYAELIETMRREPLDFIGTDYAVDNRHAEQVILPLARERGIGVLVYAPFGRTRLWERVRGRELPAWAAEFDAHSWAQFFLKYVIGHPDVTAVTPATSRARHMIDNLGAARGRLPGADLRRRMAEYVAGL